MTQKIAIIIVTYNARHFLPDCLASLRDQSYPKDLIELIIVDNHSSDSTVDYVKEAWPTAQIIANNSNLGFAEANNQGWVWAQKSGADYLFLLNQDTIVEKNCLARLAKLLAQQDKTAAVQPKIMLHPEKDLINSLGNSVHFLGFAYCNNYRHKDTGHSTPWPLPYTSGAATLVKMSALKKTGLFDGRLFMYHEDVDLGWRLRLAGFHLFIDPLAVVWHKYHFSKAKYKFYYMDRNRLMVLKENYKFATLLLLAPALLVTEVGVLFLALKNGWLKEKLKGYFWLFFHLPSTLHRRLETQFVMRKIKDREILRLMTGVIDFQEVDSWPVRYLANPVLTLYLRFIRLIVWW